MGVQNVQAVRNALEALGMSGELKDKIAEYHCYETEDDGAKKGGPKTGDYKARDYIRSKLQHEGVDDQ